MQDSGDDAAVALCAAEICVEGEEGTSTGGASNSFGRKAINSSAMERCGGVASSPEGDAVAIVADVAPPAPVVVADTGTKPAIGAVSAEAASICASSSSGAFSSPCAARPKEAGTGVLAMEAT